MTVDNESVDFEKLLELASISMDEVKKHYSEKRII
jgi:hypothetical protein